MNIQCVRCKGRGFCGRSFCPVIAKSEAMFKVKKKARMLSDSFQGEAPAPFIGHHGYPFLNAGVLSLNERKEDAWEYDAPRHWAEKNYDINKIIGFRSELVNSRFKVHAHDRSKLLDISKEVGMASKPVDIEVGLEEKPKFRVQTEAYLAPMGPSARLKQMEITSNPKVHTKVDRVVSDTDLKSNDALTYLYENGFDENFLTKILSVGTLGLKQKRKLVPTRWSITATDDSLGKHILEKIRYDQETGYNAFFGGHLGNYYLIMTFPEKWSYELFEMYMPNAGFNQSQELQFATDYENYDGRKNYADNTAGGYYAARLGVLEKLDSMKKQGSVLVLRFITGEYACPLGVWVCREACRKALNEKPIEFSDKELMLKYAKMLVKKKFGQDISGVLEKSIMLKNLREQSKLSSFF